jgi:hypothetical protein
MLNMAKSGHNIQTNIIYKMKKYLIIGLLSAISFLCIIQFSLASCPSTGVWYQEAEVKEKGGDIIVLLEYFRYVFSYGVLILGIIAVVLGVIDFIKIRASAIMPVQALDEESPESRPEEETPNLQDILFRFGRKPGKFIIMAIVASLLSLLVTVVSVLYTYQAIAVADDFPGGAVSQWFYNSLMDAGSGLIVAIIAVGICLIIRSRVKRVIRIIS